MISIWTSGGDVKDSEVREFLEEGAEEDRRGTHASWDLRYGLIW